MKIFFSFRRVHEVLNVLPEMYNVMPRSDYQAVVSHSTEDLASQAWARTGKQMRSAIKTFETKNPDAKRKLAATA